MQCTDNNSGDFTCSADYKVRIDDLCVKGEKVKGFMDFQDWLNIFIDVTELNTLDVREDDLRARFRDAILDKNHGLPCILFKHINGHQYIMLDNNEFDMVPFLQEITFVPLMMKWSKQLQIRSYFHS